MAQLRFFAILLLILLANTISAGVIDPQGNPDSPGQYENQRNNLTEIIFLGSFNGKFWWLDEEPVVQQAAAAYCGVMGFKIATIDTLDEFEWLMNRTEINSGGHWTAGKNVQRREAFDWHYAGNEELDTSIPFRGGDDMTIRTLGLVFSKGMRCLAPMVITQVLPFLCYQ